MKKMMINNDRLLNSNLDIFDKFNYFRGYVIRFVLICFMNMLGDNLYKCGRYMRE